MKIIHLSYKDLAQVCLLLIQRQAIPNFPNSTFLHPSNVVVVELLAGNRNFGNVIFPAKIQRKIWEDVVLPIVTVSTKENPTYGSGSVFSESCIDLGIEIRTALRKSGVLRNNVVDVYTTESRDLLKKIEAEILLQMGKLGYHTPIIGG